MPLLGLLLAQGCLGELLDDPVAAVALDYVLDSPRVLGLRVTPPVLVPGVPVELDLLAWGPEGTEAREATFSTCGLRTDLPTQIHSLDCFTEGFEVTVLSAGPAPAAYTPPAALSDVRCPAGSDTVPATPGTGDPGDDTGLLGVTLTGCTHELPLLVEAEVAGSTVLGTLDTSWLVGVGGIGLVVPQESTWSGTRELSWSGVPDRGAEVELELVVSGELEHTSFAWTVDAGTLLDTGRTIPQAFEEGRTITRNRWVLPETPGRYRAAVVWRAEPPPADWVTVPDIGWATTEVEVP